MKKETKKTIKGILSGILGMGMAASLASAGPGLEVEATLDRGSMSTDDAAVLTVTVSGGQEARIELQPVDGLHFQPMGSSSNVQVINGVMSATVSRTVLVQATEPGEYVIPKVRVAAGSDEAYSDEPLTLRVVKGSGRVASPGQRGAAPAPQMPGGSSSPDEVTSGRPGDLAFLEVRPAKTDLVVGEFVPVEVRAYFRAGERVSLRSMPMVGGGAFTLKNQEGDARQEPVTREGIPYTMLTFYSGLAAVKPGEFPVEVTLDATVVVREQSDRNSNRGRRPGFGSLFDDSFFGGGLLDDFFGRLVEKEVALAADPITMTVSEVPTAGRPAGFSGAVGRFSAHGSASPGSVRAGDPVTVKVQVEGAGNFDRVRMPELSDGTGWKTYPASNEFVPVDAIGSEGVKMFEQVIVPQTPDIREIPSMELFYYNPETKAFETARTEAIPLEVVGEAVKDTAAAGVSAEKGAASAEPEPVVEEGAGAVVRGLNPLYGRGWFLGVVGAAVLGVVLGLNVLWRRRRLEDASGHLAEKALRRDLAASIAEMDRAIGRNDVTGFFGTARKAVQLHAGRLLGMDAAAVTAADVKDAEMREILNAADAVAFAGGRVMAADELQVWKERAVRVLGKS